MAAEIETETLRAEIPESVLSEMSSLVEAGWFQDLDEVVVAALRGYLDSHRPELMEELIREDVAWGLRGRD